MTSIFFIIARICRNQFKCNYLKNKKFFTTFAAFLKLTFDFEVLEKKTTLIDYVFLKLETGKDLVRHISEKFGFRTPFDIQNVKGS